MKEIQLTLNKVAIVDDCDFDRLNQYKWHAARNHNGDYYAVRAAKRANGTQKTIYMHREILNASAKTQVDHRSRNTLINTRANLRECTPAQNSMNKKNQTGSKSIYKGVSVHRNKWQSAITLCNKRFYLGTFEIELDAALAYDNKAKELFGEFANLNFKAA